MKTYREIVYLIMDELKILSDDSLFETDHILAFCNKYRSLLIKQRYLDKKREIPTAFYQRLNVSFDTVYYRGDIYKSTKEIPSSIDNGILHTYTYVSPNGISSMNFNFVNPQRFKVVGYNKWLKNEVYVTVDLDNYMYIKSPLGDATNAVPIAGDLNDGTTSLFTDESANYQLVLESLADSYVLFDTILDNPIDADRFNGVNTLDVLDLDFPCDEALFQTIVELTIKEIATLNGIPRDLDNNANDDTSLINKQNKQ